MIGIVYMNIVEYRVLQIWRYHTYKYSKVYMKLHSSYTSYDTLYLAHNQLHTTVYHSILYTIVHTVPALDVVLTVRIIYILHYLPILQIVYCTLIRGRLHPPMYRIRKHTM